MSDQELIQQITARDQEAMLGLYRRYADLIYSIVYRVLNDSAAAEECVQDAFLKVWQNAAQFDAGRGPLIAWLIGIARNLAIDRLRQQVRRQRSGPEQALNDGDEGLALDVLNDWQSRERANALRLSLQTLPPEQIQVLELAYFGGMSQSEIADYLSIPLGTVKTRMRLGMQKLKDLWLEDQG
jgi:RNA polymerase sigma-70 factor (ECF subfamily)